MDDLLEVCERAVKKAELIGASEAEAYASLTKEGSVLLENNDVKMVKSHSYWGIGIRVLKERSLGFASTNVRSPDAVDDAVTDALKIASATPQDPYNKLPEAKSVKELQELYDRKAEDFKVEDAIDAARLLLTEAKGYDRRVSVDSGHFSTSVVSRAIYSSKGMRWKESISLFSWSILGVAVDGDEVSSFDFQFDATHRVDAINVAKTARELAKNVVGSLGARSIESFKGSVVLSPEAATELIVEPIAFSVNSNNIQKGLSKFSSKLGESVASSSLTILDDGSLPDGLASTSFDREGLPHRPVKLVEDGIFRTSLHNTYTASKDGVESTGHAAGDFRSTPSVAPTNIIVREGGLTKEEILQEVKKGIFVTRFSGNLNPVSGDFSGVAKGGYYIEKGELRHPIRETLMAGNAFELLKNISAISKEAKRVFSFIVPYIRVEEVSITGG